MPDLFIEQLKKDIDGCALDRKFYKNAGIDEVTLQSTLAGEVILPRQKVIALAMALGRFPDHYLLAADYTPDNLKGLGEHTLARVMFRADKQVSKAELQKCRV